MAIYKGSEVKFAIDIVAQGFSMDDDDFEIEVASPRNSVKGYKTPEAGDPKDIVIFKETVTPAEGDPTSQWYAILDTQKLYTGDLRVIAKAFITDANANDGVRTEIAVTQLDKLINP